MLAFIRLDGIWAYMIGLALLVGAGVVLVLELLWTVIRRRVERPVGYGWLGVPLFLLAGGVLMTTSEGPALDPSAQVWDRLALPVAGACVVVWLLLHVLSVWGPFAPDSHGKSDAKGTADAEPSNT